MNLADFHCDTLTEIFKRNESLKENTCDVSLDLASCYKKYIQTAAVFTSPSLNDNEGFIRFNEVADYTELLSRDGSFCLCKTAGDIDGSLEKNKPAFILAVEDARILANDIDRLETLYKHGVRIITPLWAGKTCIGGSFDTDSALTDFGKAVIRSCFELGIIPDVSHASYASADEIISMAEQSGKPVIASHSDSFSVNPHPRNLRDEHFKRISALGGVVGINLYPVHIASNNTCSADDIIRHIIHYMELSNGHDIVLGCDLDGIDCHPDSINTVADLQLLQPLLRTAGLNDNTVNGILFDNGYNFLIKNLI